MRRGGGREGEEAKPCLIGEQCKVGKRRGEEEEGAEALPRRGTLRRAEFSSILVADHGCRLTGQDHQR